MKTHGTVFISNRQKVCALNTAILKRMALAVLHELKAAPASEVGLYLVEAPEMTTLNERFLRHHGSTDVITFDYADPDLEKPDRRKSHRILLHGEIFVCLAEAMIQSRKFHCDCREEIARYVVHGILHLAGFDDIAVSDRRLMKREEARLLANLKTHFDLSKLAHKIVTAYKPSSKRLRSPR